MNDRNRNGNRSAPGSGFFGNLTIAFIALKLMNVIDWPWLAVWSPLLVQEVIGVIFAVIFYKAKNP